MLEYLRKSALRSLAADAVQQVALATFEPLESRQMLSGSPFGFFGGHHGADFGGRHDERGRGRQEGSITFSLAPAAVQTGLDNLAKTDGYANVSAGQTVILGNSNGVETYTVTLNGTGTLSRLTVDPLGDPVTAPTITATTWAALSGTGSASDSAAAAEISAIATALSLAAPVTTDAVQVSTAATGAVSYTIRLSSSSSSTDAWFFGSNVTVDSAGNPIGNQQLPFSVIPSAIQTAINNHLPTAATALAITSQQNVDVRTVDGVVTYSTSFTTAGTKTIVTVDAAGNLISLPVTTTTTFSTLTSNVQTEFQTLATADGVTTDIAANQSINVLTETNGTVIYSAALGASKNDSSGSAHMFNVTIAVDSNGNPTTLPRSGFFDIGFAGWGSYGNASPGENANSSSGTSNASSGISLTSGGNASPTAVAATSISAANTSYTLNGKLLNSVLDGLTILSGYILKFAPASVSSAALADVVTLGEDVVKLADDSKALTKAEKITLKTDTATILKAIKAAGSSLAPLESTLKSDAKTWQKTLAKDQAVIHKDRKDAIALAAAKTQLASDKASASAAITRDAGAILTAVKSNSGVVAAEAKLASDLPTIGADESAIATEAAAVLSALS